MLRLATLAALSALVLGCSVEAPESSQTKISSTHSKIYEASVENIKLTFNIHDVVDYHVTSNPDIEEESKEELAKYYSSEERREEQEKEMLKTQLFFFMGSLKGQHATLARETFDIKSKKYEEIELEDGTKTHQATIVTDAKFLLTLPKKGEKPLDSYTAHLPIDMTYKHRKEMVKTNKKCFTDDLEHTMEEEPYYWPTFSFYYFDSSLEGCDVESDQKFQSLSVATKPSPLDMTEEKYPEIDKIWKDNKFIATMIFTPANDFSDYDQGVRGYTKMTKELVKTFGTPIEGPLKSELTRTPTKMARYTMSYKLEDGREMIFNLVLWNDSWRYGSDTEPGPAEILFKELSKTSDYISYNGHAGYGENIAMLEKWSTVEKGHYQIFYVDGCSTFAYIQDTMFKKRAAVNPGEPATRYLDVISNIQPSYFSYMADQNTHLLKGIVDMDKSYLDMFKNVEKDVPDQYTSMIIVAGEEDNTFKP